MQSIMATCDVLKSINKYKGFLEKENDSQKVLSVLRKLGRMKMTLEILQATGIGKTVNKLSKCNGEVGEFSNLMVSEWKSIASREKERLQSSNNAWKNKEAEMKEAEEEEKRKSKKTKHSHRNNHQEQPQQQQQRREKQPRRRVSEEEEEETNNNRSMSFEDCLGMSDSKSRKSSYLPSSSGSNSSSSSSSKTQKTEKKRKCETVTAATASASRMPTLLQKEAIMPLPSVLSLPEIQADYKPIRNHYIIDDTHTNARKRPHETDDTYFMSSRHNRTQVFSGRKNNAMSYVPTLKDAALRVLQDNPKVLLQEKRHTLFFEILEPVIARLSPDELYQLEQYNENITAESDKLWMMHCQKNFKSRCPDDDETWQELYWRMMRERESKLKNITANISASMAKSVPVRQTILAYVDGQAKPPRSVARQQAKYGTAQASSGRDATARNSKKSQLINSITQSSSSNCEYVPPPTKSSSSSQPTSSQKTVRKVAPLMQKTLKFLKNRFRR